MGTIVTRGESYRAVIRKKGFGTKTKTFSKHALAKQWIKATEEAIERSEVTNEELTIGALFKRYIDEVIPARDLSGTTINHYKQLQRWTADFRLADLGADSLIAWRKRYCPDISPSSFERYITRIWGVLRDAEAFWDVTVPYTAMRKARTVLRRLGITGGDHPRDRRPEDDELDRIVAAKGQNVPLDDLAEFASKTAMRLGEIVRLRRPDLDRKKRMILIRDRKHPTKKKGNHCLVPLLWDSMEILLRQPEKPGDDRFFPYKSPQVSRAFIDAKKRAAVPTLNFHDLRHEAISRMFEAGLQIQEVALVSGHLSWKNLKRYTNLKPGSVHQKLRTQREVDLRADKPEARI
jgi:integrase